MTEDRGLAIENLSIAFDRGRKVAVSGVSLAVAPGEALGLVGESGSGKSLTARAALGLLPRGARVGGRIRIDGKEVFALAPEQLRRIRGAGIAMVFQDPMSSLNPVAPVGQSIVQVIRSHEELSQTAAEARAVSLMDRVGIRSAKARAASFPHEFSGGMRQRIMIAMALAAKPRMLVADEPTTALDVIVQKGILELLDELRRTEGMGLLLVSHDLAVVASVCSRIAVMYAGQIVEEGPTNEIIGRSRMPYTIGLLASSRREKPARRLTSIPGSPPPLDERPASCRFAPRCPLALDPCRREAVGFTAVGRDHWSRCVRTEVIRDLRALNFDREVAHG